MMRIGLSAALVACVFCLGGAVAEEAQTPAGGYTHWLTNLPPPLPGVEAHHWFPDHPGSRFTIGGPVDVVLGLHNTARETFNITAVAGSINAPHSYFYYIQNFTLQPYNTQLRPGEQASVQYTFHPSVGIPADEWRLSLIAYLGTPNGLFSTTFFNQTVELVDRPRLIDTQFVGLGLIGLSVLAVIVLFSWDSISNLAVVKRVNRRSRKPAARPAPGPKVPEAPGTSEWLKGTNYGQEARSRIKKNNSRTKLTSSPQLGPATSPQ